MQTLTSTPLALDGDAAGLRMTPEEFDSIGEGQYDANFRYELVDGVLVVNPIEREGHSNPNEHLGYLLRDYQTRSPQGKVLDATLPERYIFLPRSRRKADRVLWAGLGRRPDPKNDPPTIVVEFVSVGKRNWMRDYVQKREEYLGIGVKEYWIVDPFRRQMIVYFAAGGDSQERTLVEGEIYTTILLPGFELPLAQLLAAADYWE